MEDKISDEDQSLQKITNNFIDSQFKDKQKKKLISEVKIPSKRYIIKKRVNKNNSKNACQKMMVNPKSFSTKNNKSLAFQASRKKKFKLNNKKDSLNQNKDNSNKCLFTEHTTTKSTISNYMNRSKKPIYRDVNDQYYTYNNTSTYEIYKAKQDSLREKQIYEEKLLLLKNHINALKKQEKQLNKKAEINREKEINKNKKKKEKELIKQAQLSCEIDKRNELEAKKRYIIEQKFNNTKGLKESQKRKLNEKIKSYKEAYIERQKVEEERIENSIKKEENYHMLVQKIKKERERIREINKQKRKDNTNNMSISYIMKYQNNMNETKKLKNELLKLESMEEKYIENLKRTKESIKNNYDDKIRNNNFQKIKINNFDNKSKKRLANSAKK